MADMICHKVYELLMSILRLYKNIEKLTASLFEIPGYIFHHNLGFSTSRI
jgi:hypothetical protein